MFDQRSEGSLESALVLLDAGQINDCASRLYYSAFQAVRHHLDVARVAPPQPSSSDRREGWTHSAVSDWIGRNQIDLLGPFQRLRSNRETADYCKGAVPLRAGQARRWKRDAAAIRSKFL